MFATLLQNLSRKSRNVPRSRRLEVETLEGRSVPSALGTLVRPAVAADWPPPPVTQAHVRETLMGGGRVDPGAANGAHIIGSAGHVASIECNITRGSGEEIPQ
ncbi:MAG: hypothetical protein HY040_06210 [Planctomycetes bacterium]|nr:hypothetical protein [Planctomycetota bacterium]